jgi:hypothetical protein
MELKMNDGANDIFTGLLAAAIVLAFVLALLPGTIAERKKHRSRLAVVTLNAEARAPGSR